jgi:hypothetical protein
MQYILLALVYFGGELILIWGLFIHFLVSRRGSECMENMIITLSAEKACKGFMFCNRVFLSKRWVVRPVSSLSG